MELASKYTRPIETKEENSTTRKHEWAQATMKKKDKAYSDYDWTDLYRSGNLKKLVSYELNKYLQHHKMKNKCALPRAAKLKLFDGLVDSSSEDDSAESDEEVIAVDNDNDELLAIIEDDTEDMMVVTTRQGRKRKSTFETLYADYTQ